MKGLFVRTKEKQYGPLSEHDFRRMIMAGRITAEDLVWHYYQNIWVEAQRIEKYKPLFTNNKHLSKNRIVAIGSGKGGVGKTALTASMGIQLAALNKRVVLVDADFGSPNLHEWMGIHQPSISLQAFFEKQAAHLKDVAIKTPVRNLRLISGASGNLGIANLKHFQTLRFIKSLHSLDADFVLIDLGPGSSYKVIDLFLSADESIIVSVPESTAIIDAFNFLKICLLRELKRNVEYSATAAKILAKAESKQTGNIRSSFKAMMMEMQKADKRAWSICVGVLKSFRPKLVLNMLFDRREDREGFIFKAALEKLLLINVDYLGYVEFDYNAREASKQAQPYFLTNGRSKGSKRYSDISPGHLLSDKPLRNRRLSKALKTTTGNTPSSADSMTVGSKVFGDVVELVDL
jgi:flagellar biosynthesis protein FlhG